MAVTLYYTPAACSLAIHALLIAAKVDYKLAKVQLHEKLLEEDGSDYLKVNPYGTVPALRLENGEIMTESLAISTYISSISSVENLKLDSVREFKHWEAMGVCYDLQATVASVFYGLDESVMEFFIGRINRSVGKFDKRLEARSTKFWLADYPTFPDFHAVTILKWADMFKVDLSQYKHVAQLKEQVIASEAYAQACKEEGL